VAHHKNRPTPTDQNRVVILLTFAIYIRAGREIYKKHKQLKEFSFSTSHHEPEPIGIEDLFSSTKTTEVYVTTEVVDKPGTIDLAPLGGGERRRSQAGQIHPPQKPVKAAYSVTISSNRHNRESNPDTNPDNNNNNYAPKNSITADAQTNPAHLTRTHTLTHSTSTNTNPKPPLATTASSNPNPLRRRAAFEANNATWSYTKCAILFFTAMLVTWIPSSANRVYSVIHAGQASLALEYMSAFVLPLQGWWNAVIYCVTSWGACKMLWEDIRAYWWGWSCCFCCVGGGGRRGRGRGRRRGRVGEGQLMDGAGAAGGIHGGGGGHDGVGLHLHRSAFQMMGRGGNGGEGKTYETESMTELAASRPGSSGSPVSADVEAGMEMGRQKREREV
jgi:hypothetical protein